MSDNQTNVVIHHANGHCEDWGYYEYGHVAITRSGVEIFRKGWSDHLGGELQGPDYDLAEFVQQILLGLGVDATVTQTPEEEV